MTSCNEVIIQHTNILTNPSTQGHDHSERSLKQAGSPIAF